jgi:hypothetical protein
MLIRHKQLCLVLFLLTYTENSTAQIQNIPISDHVTIDKLYTGILTKSQVSTDSLYSYNQTTFRVGVFIKYRLNKKIYINAFDLVRLSNGATATTGSIASNNSFEIVYTPGSALSIFVGPGTTLTTEMRPNPTTAESQVETFTQSQVIGGGRLMTKVKYVFGSGIILGGGFSYFHNTLAKHLNFAYHGFRLAYYIENGSHFFATDARTKFVDYTITYKQSQNISTSVFLKFSHQWTPYVDISLGTKSDDVIFFEAGLRKGFSNAAFYTGGFVGLTYNYISKTISGNLFMHLSGRYEKR